MPAPALPRLTALALSALIAATAGAAPGSGDLYRVTSKMDMPGMPVSMPAHTSEVCAAREAGANMVPHEKNCRVEDYRDNGSKASYRLVCTGKDAMSGEGEMERLADGYRGSVHVVMGGAADGQEMTLRYEGKRIGSCDVATESPAAKGRAMQQQVCEQQLDVPSAFRLFTDQGGACGAQRAAFCQRLQQRTAKMTDPAAFADGEVPGLWDAASACGQSRDAVLGQACRRADADGDLAFIGAQCPDLLPRACERADVRRDADFLVASCGERARGLAAQQCEGRGYTAMLSSPYRDFCSRYASQRLRERNAPAAADGRGRPEAAAQGKPGKPSWRDKLKGLKDGIGGD